MMPTTRSYGPGITGAQDPIALDYLPTSWITAAVDPISTLDAVIEVTLDDVFDQSSQGYVDPSVASWFPWVGAFPLLVPPLTATGYSVGPGPWRAIRLNITTNGTGVLFYVGQATTSRY